jgi:basic membrane protein A
MSLDDTGAPAPAGGGPVGELRTFLIADVRGYTRYTDEHGDEQAAALAARFAEVARQGIEAHGGELLELRGDEALGVFTSARQALRAAVELQRVFGERPGEESPFPLGVGIGLDAGEGVPVEGGLRSGGLNLAARLCSLAAPGQILASETVVSLARRVEGIRFEHRGSERFKGLEQPVRVIEVLSEAPGDRSPSTQGASGGRRRRTHLPRRPAVVILVSVVAVAAGVLALALLGDVGGTEEDAPRRVALVLGADPSDNPLAAQFSEGLLRADRAFDLETMTFAGVDLAPTPASIERLSEELHNGDFDLVLWDGFGNTAAALVDDVKDDRDTRHVYFDTELSGELGGGPNMTAFRFDAGPAAQLAGYLGGLMEERRSARAGEGGAVSVVGGFPIPAVTDLAEGFVAGARRALPGVDARVDYSQNFLDQPVCENIANEQIERGSHVVFAAAGNCGTGALAAAGIRRVWGVGVDRDQSYLGRHILASVVKRFDRAVELAVRRFLEGSLPAGETVELGLEDDAIGVVGISPDVPPAVRKKVAQEAARLRAQEAPLSP